MDIDLLEKMTRFNAVVGNEYALAEWLLGELEPHATRVRMDRLGNVYAWRGEEPRVGIFAHMDSVGFVVEEIHEGHVKVVKMGGSSTPEYAPMVVETDAGELFGTLLVPEEKRFLIDLWDEAATAKVQVGDVAAFAPNFRAADGLIHSRWLDNKLGLWVAVEAWKQAGSALFVGTVREEHPAAGAGAAALQLPELELAIVVDITYAEGPTVPYMIHWGEGPAITLRDAQVHDRRWVKAMLEVARAAEIPAQIEIVTSGGSDAMHISVAGLPAVFVGLPIRYAHTPAEVTRLSDSERAVELILCFLERHGDGQLKGKG